MEENTNLKEQEVIEQETDAQETVEQTEEELYEEVFQDEMKSYEEELNTAKQERDEYKEKYLYSVAELDNARKRFSTERGNIYTSAVNSVVSKLFPILDDFERAKAGNENIGDPEVLKESFNVIYSKIVSVLDSIGIKKIESDGAEFDTDYHEAVATIPSKDNAGKVIATTEAGYTYNDKVIKHAKVIVAE